MTKNTMKIRGIDEDEQIRTNISQFLESYKSLDRYTREQEVKVLSWAEIYFELGKLKNDFNSMNEILALRQETKRLYQDIEMLNKKVYPEEVREIKNLK